MPKVKRDLMYGLQALPSFPIVLVTVGHNIMTAAAFHFYSFEPPSVMVGIRPKNLTFKLIQEKREYGINIPTMEQLELVRVCGSVSGRDEDKFKKTGLTPQKAHSIDSSLIQECPINLECQVVHEIQFGGSHRWFVGELKAVHAEEEYTRDQALMYWLREYRNVGKVLLKVDRR